MASARDKSRVKVSGPSLIPAGELAGRPAIPLTRPITVAGSRNNCRLHLVSRTVSKAHALLVMTRHTVFVHDLASREGTFVNGESVKNRDLADGDILKIGRFEFIFATGGARLRPHREPAPPPATIRAAGSDLPPVPLEGRVALIGRRADADIAFTEQSVSAAHAVIVSWEGKRYIRDLGSRSGTFVNDKPVHQQEITPRDTVRVGDTTLLYEPSTAGAGVVVVEAPSESAVARAIPAQEIESVALTADDTRAPAEKPNVSPPDDRKTRPASPIESRPAAAPGTAAAIALDDSLGGEPVAAVAAELLPKRGWHRPSAEEQPPAPPAGESASPVAEEIEPPSLTTSAGATDVDTSFAGASFVQPDAPKLDQLPVASDSIHAVVALPVEAESTKIETAAVFTGEATTNRAATAPAGAGTAEAAVGASTPDESPEPMADTPAAPLGENQIASLLAPPTITVQAIVDSSAGLPSLRIVDRAVPAAAPVAIEPAPLDPVSAGPASITTPSPIAFAAAATSELVEPTHPTPASALSLLDIDPAGGEESSTDAAPPGLSDTALNREVTAFSDPAGEPVFNLPSLEATPSTAARPTAEVPPEIPAAVFAPGNELPSEDAVAAAMPLPLESAAGAVDWPADPASADRESIPLAEAKSEAVESATADSAAAVSKDESSAAESPDAAPASLALPLEEFAASKSSAPAMSATGDAVAASPNDVIDFATAASAANPLVVDDALDENLADGGVIEATIDFSVPPPGDASITWTESADSGVPFADAPFDGSAEISAGENVESAGGLDIESIDSLDESADDSLAGSTEPLTLEAIEAAGPDEHPPLAVVEEDAMPAAVADDVLTPAMPGSQNAAAEDSLAAALAELPADTIGQIERANETVDATIALPFSHEPEEPFVDDDKAGSDPAADLSLPGEAGDGEPTAEVLTADDLPLSEPAAHVFADGAAPEPSASAAVESPQLDAIDAVLGLNEPPDPAAEQAAIALSGFDPSAAESFPQSETSPEHPEITSPTGELTEVETGQELASLNLAELDDAAAHAAAPAAAHETAFALEVPAAEPAPERAAPHHATAALAVGEMPAGDQVTVVSPAAHETAFAVAALSLPDSIDPPGTAGRDAASVKAPAASLLTTDDVEFPAGEPLDALSLEPPPIPDDAPPLEPAGSSLSDDEPFIGETGVTFADTVESAEPGGETLTAGASARGAGGRGDDDGDGDGIEGGTATIPPISAGGLFGGAASTQSPFTFTATSADPFGAMPRDPFAPPDPTDLFDDGSANDGSAAAQSAARAADEAPSDFGVDAPMAGPPNGTSAEPAPIVPAAPRPANPLAARQFRAVPRGQIPPPAEPRMVIPPADTDGAIDLHELRRRRLKLIPGILISALILMGIASAGVWYGVPVYNDYETAVKFENFGALTIAERKLLQEEQRSILRGDATRRLAVRELRTQHPELTSGFLDSTVSYDRTIMLAGWPENRPGELVLSHRGSDEGDRARLHALAVTVAMSNQGKNDTANRIRRSVKDLEDQVDSNTRKLADLKAQIERERLLGEKRPDPGQIDQLEKAVLENEKAWTAVLAKLKNAQAEEARIEQQLAAARSSPPRNIENDEELNALTAKLSDLLAEYKSLQSRQSQQATVAREEIDTAMDSFQKQIASIRGQAGESPELGKYIASAEELQKTTRQLLDEMISRQQQQYQRLSEFKVKLDEQAQRRATELREGDPQLKGLYEEREIARRQVNAGLGAGLDAKEVAPVQERLKLIESAIKGREEVLSSDPLYAEAITSLQRIIDQTQTDIATDRKKADERLDELQRSFAASSPAVANMPESQKQVAEDVKKELSTIEMARKRYADIVEADRQATEQKLKDTQAEIASLRGEVDSRSKLLADEIATKSVAALSAAREKQHLVVVEAQSAESAARELFETTSRDLRAGRDTLAALQNTDDRMSRWIADKEQTENFLKNLNDQLSFKRANEANRLVTVAAPSPAEVFVIQGKDPRLAYILAVVGAVIVLASGSVWYTIHSAHHLEAIAAEARPVIAPTPKPIDPAAAEDQEAAIV